MSSGWWKADVVEGGGGNWGSLDRVFDKSLVAKSQYFIFLRSHIGRMRSGEQVIISL